MKKIFEQMYISAYWVVLANSLAITLLALSILLNKCSFHGKGIVNLFYVVLVIQTILLFTLYRTFKFQDIFIQAKKMILFVTTLAFIGTIIILLPLVVHLSL